MNKPRSYSEFGKTSLSAPWSPSREGTSGGTKHPKGTCALFPVPRGGFGREQRTLCFSLPLNSHGCYVLSPPFIERRYYCFGTFFFSFRGTMLPLLPVFEDPSPRESVVLRGSFSQEVAVRRSGKGFGTSRPRFQSQLCHCQALCSGQTPPSLSRCGLRVPEGDCEG